MTVNYSVIVSCSAHFPPGGRNLGSTTDRVIADSRYSESRYSEAQLYKKIEQGKKQLSLKKPNKLVEDDNDADSIDVHSQTSKSGNDHSDIN